MKHKQTHFVRASFAALIFVILGYVVKFYPEVLTDFDSTVQTNLRGDLSQAANRFWSAITLIGEAHVLIPIVIILALFFYWKQWKSEAAFISIALVIMMIASTGLKYLYQRPRPSIEWVVHTTGYSFPSWHTASTMLVAGILAIIIYQRIKQKWLRSLLQVGLIGLAILIALSRIYVGVHHPTDIVAGWLLAYAITEVLYPFYDQKRFEWRFQNKQK